MHPFTTPPPSPALRGIAKAFTYPQSLELFNLQFANIKARLATEDKLLALQDLLHQVQVNDAQYFAGGQMRSALGDKISQEIRAMRNLRDPVNESFSRLKL